MQRNSIGLVVLATLLAGAIAWLLLNGPVDPPALRSAGSMPEAAPDRPIVELPSSPIAAVVPATAVSGEVHVETAGADFATLPADQRIVALEQAAAQGDAIAACRAAAELIRCRSMRAWTETSDTFYIDQLARMELSEAQLERATAKLVEATAANRRLKEECLRVPTERLARIGYHHLASARAGNVDSMLLFANAVGIGGEEMVADPGLYALYRAHGWEMFRGAFEAGDPKAVFAWVSALDSRGFSFLGGLLPPDWRTPDVARELNRRLFQHIVEPQDAVAPTDLSPEVAAQVDELFERHFARSPRRGSFADALLEQKQQEDALRTSLGIGRLPGMQSFPLNDQHCENPAS
jgi:hypothetical protein